MRWIQHPVARYVLPLAALAFTLWVTHEANAYGIRLQSGTPITLGLIATGWYVGRGPGIVFAVAFEAAIDYFGVNPTDRATFIAVVINRLVLFVGIVWFASGARRAVDAADVARREAEAANRIKDDFLATLSHELRTPLNAILGWSATLNRTEATPEVQRKALAAIGRNAHTQMRLVNDVLDAAYIARGTLHVRQERVSLNAAVLDAVNMLEHAAAAKHIAVHLQVAPSVMVVGDADRLRQIVWNLLSNAIKFSADRGDISVTLARDGDSAQLSVADNGVGIPATFLPHVFDQFRQGDASATREHAGLGLGLAIVHHPVSAHGGTVRADSRGAGTGAAFMVDLPVAAESADLAVPDVTTTAARPTNTLSPMEAVASRASE